MKITNIDSVYIYIGNDEYLKSLWKENYEPKRGMEIVRHYVAKRPKFGKIATKTL